MVLLIYNTFVLVIRMTMFLSLLVLMFQGEFLSLLVLMFQVEFSSNIDQLWVRIFLFTKIT